MQRQHEQRAMRFSAGRSMDCRTQIAISYLCATVWCYFAADALFLWKLCVEFSVCKREKMFRACIRSFIMNILQKLKNFYFAFRHVVGTNNIDLQLASRWRAMNTHNNTQLKRGEIDKIKVGTGSYGPLDVICFHNEQEGLRIGNYVSIAEGVTFVLAGNHRTDTFSTYPIHSLIQKPYSPAHDALCKGEIIVDDEAWIGMNATIVSGVHIGMGAVVAAGSVVTKDVPPFALVGGNPARFIKWRIPEELIERRSRIRLADLDESIICKHIHLFYQTLDTQVLDAIEALPRKQRTAVRDDKHSM